MASYHISTKQQREEWELNNAYCKWINNPTPANPYRFEGVTLDRNGIAVPNGWKHITIESQSHCRGEFPRVYLDRDYNHERGEFPRVDTPKPQPKPVKIDRANEQAKETLRRLTKLYKGELEFKDGDLVDVEKPGKPKGNGKPENPLHKAWKELKEKERNGETYPYRTPPIPRIITSEDLTPRQVMARAIPAAIARIPQSWGDKDKIDLPYGFYMQRKGFDEARIYHPKHRGSIPAGFLGKGWQVNPSHMLRNSLDTIESIIKRYKLDKPTPPTSPASNPVNAEAA